MRSNSADSTEESAASHPRQFLRYVYGSFQQEGGVFWEGPVINKDNRVSGHTRGPPFLESSIESDAQHVPQQSCFPNQSLNPKPETQSPRPSPTTLPKGSNVVPFWVCYGFWVRDYNILPKKELHWSPWVNPKDWRMSAKTLGVVEMLHADHHAPDKESCHANHYQRAEQNRNDVLGTYLDGQRDVANRLIMGITRAIIWFIGSINLLTKSPWPSK